VTALDSYVDCLKSIQSMRFTSRLCLYWTYCFSLYNICSLFKVLMIMLEVV